MCHLVRERGPLCMALRLLLREEVARPPVPSGHPDAYGANLPGLITEIGAKDPHRRELLVTAGGSWGAWARGQSS